MMPAFVAWQPLVQTLGWTLVHFLWQGVVIGAAFAAVRAVLPRARCNARYAVGLVALAALSIWPVVTFIALLPQPPLIDAAVAAASLPGANPVVYAGAAESGLAATIDGVLPWLVLLWGSGVLGMAGRALWQWRALTRIARRWAVSNTELDAMLLTLARRFRFMRRVRVLVSERIHTPMLIGWLKPVVLLPTAVALGFPRQQVELILAHELGHLQRYDHLVNLAQALLETLLFYHPVVHWISREVRNERELCCDALVLQVTRGEPTEYARTLASLEEMRQDASMVLAATGGDLLERVRRIVGIPAPRLSAAESRGQARWLFAIAALGLVLVTVLRIERAHEVPLITRALAVDWLAASDLRTLPLAALTLPFERPRLRLPAPVAAPPREDASTTQSAAAAGSAAGMKTVATGAAGAVETAAADMKNEPVAATSVAAAVAPAPMPAAISAKAAPAPAMPAHEAPRASIAISKPVATHVVEPRYPSFARHAAGRVEASFSIAADGRVNDIRFAGGGEDAFTRAADRALRQWRFDPASLSGDRSMRYTQTFVFAPRDQAGGARGDCVQVTGSLICRDPADAALARVAISGDDR